MYAKERIIRLLFILVLCFCALSCKKSSSNPVEPAGNNGTKIATDTKTGTIKQVEGASISTSQMKIVSFAGQGDFDVNGNFSVTANQAGNFQQLFALSKSTGNLIYSGLFDPTTKKVTMNDTSSVVSFLMMNPILIGSDVQQRNDYITTVKNNAKFSQLLTQFRNAVKSNAENVFDYNTNPLFYQTAIEIMKESVQALENKSLRKKTLWGDEPVITDATGEEIVFENPTHIFYTAAIYPDDKSLKDIAVVERQEHIVGLKWTWPPVTWNEPARTNYKLGNGYYRVYLNKGFAGQNTEIKNISLDDPVFRALSYNVGQSIFSIIEVSTSLGAFSKIVLNFPKHFQNFHITGQRIVQLSMDIKKQEPLSFAYHIGEVMRENSEGIALWLWEETQNNATHLYIDAVAGVLKNISLVYKIFSIGNGAGPFFYDLVFAPGDLNYYITQQNGVITSTKKNAPPTPEFKINPSAGIVSTNFEFDGSFSSDDNDSKSSLVYRWDWESDGTYDTDWISNPKTNHKYSSASTYTITMQVKDIGGLIGEISHSLNIVEGYGNASHIKLFMDINPWKSDAMIRMLQKLEFTEGYGSNTYEILTSSKMGTTTLSPGVDLVIISNDQTQTFYDNYAMNQILFNNFVNNGGALFWEACDKGWNYGSMQSAGVILPGNLRTTFKNDYYNYVTNSSLPLVDGLPSTLDHNYASHESFSNLPDGTIIYCVNSNSNPTLIEFNLGAGWVLVSGQPLEHQYDKVYGKPDMEKLLPRIVSRFTGKKSSKSLNNINLILSETSSYLK